MKRKITPELELQFYLHLLSKRLKPLIFHFSLTNIIDAMNTFTWFPSFCYPFCNHIAINPWAYTMSGYLCLNTWVYMCLWVFVIWTIKCVQWAVWFWSINTITINMCVISYSLQSAVSYVITFNSHNCHMV